MLPSHMHIAMRKMIQQPRTLYVTWRIPSITSTTRNVTVHVLYSVSKGKNFSRCPSQMFDSM